MSATNSVGLMLQDVEPEEILEGSEDWVLEGSFPSFAAYAKSDLASEDAASPSSEPSPEDVALQILSSEVNLAQSTVATDSDELEVVLSIIAPLGNKVARAPLRLVAVLDKSSSTLGEKLRLVVEALCFICE